VWTLRITYLSHVYLSVPEAEGNGGSPWFIFNDFVVCNIPEDEAISFPGKWKVGLVFMILKPENNSLSLRLRPSSTWNGSTHGIVSISVD